MTDRQKSSRNRSNGQKNSSGQQKRNDGSRSRKKNTRSKAKKQDPVCSGVTRRNCRLGTRRSRRLPTHLPLCVHSARRQYRERPPSRISRSCTNERPGSPPCWGMRP